MRKVFSFALMLLLLASCSSPEKKAHKLIKNNLLENLKDPSSYEPVSFTPLDSIFTPYIATEEGRKLFDDSGFSGQLEGNIKKLSKQISKAKTIAELDLLEDSIKYYKNKQEELREMFDNNDAVYQGEHIGWITTHRYRAKNGFGALDFEEQVFYLDKDITEIRPRYGKSSIYKK